MGNVVKHPSANRTPVIGFMDTALNAYPIENIEGETPAVELGIDAQVEQLLRQGGEFKISTVTLTGTVQFSVTSDDGVAKTSTAVRPDFERSARRHNDVPLHSLLKFASGLLLFTSVASLTMWLNNLPPMLNPFVSLLSIIASPFIYLMGATSQKARGSIE